MATKDVTVDGNLTDMSTIAATDRLLVIDDGTTALQDLEISVLSAYLAALSQTLTSKTLTSPTINTATIATPTVTALTLDGKRFSIGDAAHAAPSAGDLWWETDTGLLWTYGTYASASRWVSATLYQKDSGQLIAAQSANTVYAAGLQVTAGYDVYIDDFWVKAHVITTNTGSAYWNWDLRKIGTSVVPASAAGTLLGSGLDSSAKSPDVWFELTESIDAVIDGTGASMEYLIMDMTKTSTPGNVWTSHGISYRLVHP
jgi:hypothetical protein